MNNLKPILLTRFYTRSTHLKSIAVRGLITIKNWSSQLAKVIARKQVTSNWVGIS